VKIYMSGATALRAIVGGLFTQHCGPDLDVYYSGVGTFSGVSFATAGDAHRVYACTMKSTSPILPNKRVALFKSDLGGSGQGVFPVYFLTPRGFLDLETCGARVATVPNYTCAGEQIQVPMAGVSDVEPGLFKGANVPKDDASYPQDGLTPAQLAGLRRTTVFQTVFAVAVNTSLRNAMQAAQGLPVGSEVEADQPSISRALATSYFSGSLADPSAGLGWQPLLGATGANAASRVNVCRRVDGSGTQSSANAFFNLFPCSPGAVSIANNASSDPPLPNSITSVGPNGSYFVFEGSTTGNVIDCLTTAEANGAYALGHVSRENAPGTRAWRHVKIDGVFPSRETAKRGLYDYFFESTIQWRTSYFNTLSADQRTFLTQFAAEARKPASLANLSAAAQQGVAALPQSYSGAFGAPGQPAEVLTFGSRVSRGGNSCTPPTLFK
jgi:hypothetical protein